MATGGFVLRQNEYDVKKTGTSTSVPNNPRARLMYYMSCVSTVMDLEEAGISRLTDYANYWRLDQSDTNYLIRLCLLFSPDQLLNEVFFLSTEIDSANNSTS